MRTVYLSNVFRARAPVPDAPYGLYYAGLVAELFAQPHYLDVDGPVSDGVSAAVHFVDYLVAREHPPGAR